MSTSTRYRFGPRSTRGLVAGWRAGQILVAGAGALVALGAVHSLGGASGVGLGLLAVALALAISLWPVAGRPAESWAPILARHLLRRAGSPRGRPRTARAPAGGLLGGLVLSSREHGPFGELGIIEDRIGGTVSAALAAGGTGFALLDEEEKSSAVAAWSDALAALAREGALRSVQWIATSRPAQIRAAVPIGPSRAAAGYAAFLEEIRPRLWEREVLVTVTAKTGAARSRGGGGAEVLGHLLAELSERLRAAGLVVGPPLGMAALERAVASAFGLPGLAADVEVEERWHALRTGTSWHATYWVSEWPRSEVGPAVLVPLLVATSQRRTVTMTMTPLPPISAVRRAERERTAGASDAELRRRHGFTQTARARAEQELRQQREGELAEGHAAYLFSGYVSVTADDEAGLARACAEAEQSAALCQLELRRLYGQQHEAWLCALPAGRGR